MPVNSVSGTALQIDVADGTNDAVVSIDSGYVGQASINTLGTVTTGTWNAGDVTTSGTINLPNTSSSSVGVLNLNSARMLHTGSTGNAAYNTYLGWDAGNFTPFMTANTGIGAKALTALSSGNNNTAVGSQALIAQTGGSFNIGLGSLAADRLVSGSYNIGIGTQAGHNWTGSESSNISIGYSTQAVTGESNVLRIGNATGTAAGGINKAFICGITGKTSASGVAVLVNSSNQLGTTTSSRRFKRNIKDMGNESDFLMKLRPVTFQYNEDIDDATDEMKFGLIAEEVAAVKPELVAWDEENKPYTVRYNDLPAILLNELQKLSKRVQELEAKMVA